MLILQWIYIFKNAKKYNANPLSANPTKWSNTLKQFVGFYRQIVWVCLAILRDWRLKGSIVNLPNRVLCSVSIMIKRI